MKKFIFLAFFFVVNLAFADKNSSFLHLANEANFPVKLSNEASAFLNKKATVEIDKNISSADKLIQFSVQNNFAFKWNKKTKKYTAVPKNNEWKLSCKKIASAKNLSKIEPLLFSVESYQTGDEPDFRVIDIFGFSLSEKTELKNAIIKNNGARESAGVNLANTPPYNYSGTNVDVFVYDGGIVAHHDDLLGRLR